MKHLLSIAVAAAAANLSLSVLAEDRMMEHVIVSDLPLKKRTPKLSGIHYFKIQRRLIVQC